VAREATQHTSVEYRYFGDYHLAREMGHVIASQGVFEDQPLSAEQRAKGLALASAMFNVFFGMHDRFLDYAQRYVARARTPRRPAPTLPKRQPRASGGAPAPRSTVRARNGEVQRALDVRRARTAAHPFFTWLRQDHTVSPADKLRRFLPLWAVDIMGYRDLNRYALRFDVADTEAKRAVNRCAETLTTHSALFLNDWDALGLDAALGWCASETLTFLFLDTRTDLHRRNIAEFIKLALRHPQPVLRFWLLEALEASGEAFFATTRELAAEVEAATGMRLDYLADRHDLVHGDLQTVPLREAFPLHDQAMTAEDTAIALRMVHTVFDAVDAQLRVSHVACQSNTLAIYRRLPVRRIVGGRDQVVRDHVSYAP
jgi:hypothetical protein